MTSTPPATQTKSRSRDVNRVFYVLLGAGFLLRLRLAWMTFLNPDEALHYYLAHQPSLKLAYQASLTTAHPPLMIIFLHYWSLLGHSEFFLRLPFVAAGTAFCWVMFLWLRKVASDYTACYGLTLFLFLPPLISLSAELRQYALLLLFCACCLYLLEYAFRQTSATCMLLSAVFLWLALLTHYSALIFAAAFGVYALIVLLALLNKRPSAAVSSMWSAGQMVALAICAFLFESQVSKLRQSGVPSEIAGTWLRGSIFHPGESGLLTFVWHNSLRLFRYFFSNGTIGLLGLLLFLSGVLMVFRVARHDDKTQHSLGVLLLLPFLLTLVAAISGVYPYGGSRHDILLAIFAIPGIAIGLDYLLLGPDAFSKWFKPVLLAVALLVANFFPSPTGPYIRPRNQRRELMQAAMNSLRSLPPNSFIFTDEQGVTVLNYYLCDEAMALPFSSQTPSFLRFRCGDHEVLVATGTQTGFDRTSFANVLQNAWREITPTDRLYLFQSGWIDDKEQAWLSELRQLGGDPQTFGSNILVCRIDAKK